MHRSHDDCTRAREGRRGVAAWGAVVLLILAACSGGQEPGDADRLQGRLVLTGSSTVAPLAGEIAKRFEAEHAGVRVDVQTGGSSRGIADVRRGTADIGMVSRALAPEEADLDSHTVALDGVTLIVHGSNPVAELDADQVVAIYTGEVADWSEVGGEPGPITVVHKAEGRSTLEVFLEHFGLDNRQVQPTVIIGDNQQGVQTVLGDPNALGYVSIGAAQVEVDRGGALKLLPLGGVAPSVASVRDGSFPLSRQLNLVTLGPVSPLARAFLDYSRSPAVYDLVEAQYFVTVDLGSDAG
ncbi:MAG: phosphate ABC transporter substrate-binding protein [Acidobacteriota bacterium]|nr:phosphate ABC transporter substrate-binding protein [Acidobacteriota bacterium]